MDVVLIRHARPAVEEGICYGSLDLALATPVMPAPAAMSRALPGYPPARIIASPLTRAAQTAALLRDAWPVDRPGAAPLPAIELEARLREVDFGAWEGLPWDAIARAQLDAWAADLLGARPHGGESTGQALARVAGWADALCAAAARDGSNGSGCIWVVCHAGPMRMLAAHWLGVPLARTLNWQIGFGASASFRLGGYAPALAWWNRPAAE